MSETVPLLGIETEYGIIREDVLKFIPWPRMKRKMSFVPRIKSGPIPIGK